MRQMHSQVLLDAVTTTGEGPARQPWGTKRTFQLVATDDDATGTATVLVEVSNDGTNWVTLTTFTVAFEVGTITDGFASDAAWKFVRGNVTALANGNAPTLTLLMANPGATG